MAGKAGMKRKDNWTDSEVIIMVNTVLAGIKAGKAINMAMDEISIQINRTPDACSRHWFANVRKNHLSAYNHAKAEALLGREIQ